MFKIVFNEAIINERYVRYVTFYLCLDILE